MDLAVCSEVLGIAYHSRPPDKEGVGLNAPNMLAVDEDSAVRELIDFWKDVTFREAREVQAADRGSAKTGC